MTPEETKWYLAGYRAGVKKQPQPAPLQPLLDQLYVTALGALLTGASRDDTQALTYLAASIAKEALRLRPRP